MDLYELKMDLCSRKIDDRVNTFALFSFSLFSGHIFTRYVESEMIFNFLNMYFRHITKLL